MDFVVIGHEYDIQAQGLWTGFLRLQNLTWSSTGRMFTLAINTRVTKGKEGLARVKSQSSLQSLWICPPLESLALRKLFGNVKLGHDRYFYA